MKNEYDLLTLYNKFCRHCASGRRLQKNGKRIKSGSLVSYHNTGRLLSEFSSEVPFKMAVKHFKGTKAEFQREKRYWKRFYRHFCDFLYDKCGCFDNYVGSQLKNLRVFFNWLRDEEGILIGNFHTSFFCPHEEIPIVTLTPERLNFFIYDKKFESLLSPGQRVIKDLFVLGCTAALRISDLMSLQLSDIEQINGRYYLRRSSKKTNVFTRTRLPEYAAAIINKYSNGKQNFLPRLSLNYFGLGIKAICKLAGFTEDFPKIRMRRGKPVVIYKDPKRRLHYRFCDLVSSHTMRRTGITMLLSLGMKEDQVRLVSGHRSGSPEFWRYVNYAQAYLDDSMDHAFEQLKARALKPSLKEPEPDAK